MNKKHLGFNTICFDSRKNTSVRVFVAEGDGPLMGFAINDKYTYISKQQAMDFFGLVDPVSHTVEQAKEDLDLVEWAVLYTHQNSRNLLVQIFDARDTDHATETARMIIPTNSVMIQLFKR
jgi:hypothetical protein